MGWHAYSKLVLCGLASIVLVVGFSLLTHVFRRPQPSRSSSSDEPPQPESHQKKSNIAVPHHFAVMNSRFFQAVNLAGVFICLVLLLVPVTAVFKELIAMQNTSHVYYALTVLVCLVSIAASSLFYSVRKGDLNWKSNLSQDETPS